MSLSWLLPWNKLPKFNILKQYITSHDSVVCVGTSAGSLKHLPSVSIQADLEDPRKPFSHFWILGSPPCDLLAYGVSSSRPLVHGILPYGMKTGFQL